MQVKQDKAKQDMCVKTCSQDWLTGSHYKAQALYCLKIWLMGSHYKAQAPYCLKILARKAPYADQDLYKINQVQNYDHAGQGCSRHNKIMSCSMHVKTSKTNKYLFQNLR